MSNNVSHFRRRMLVGAAAIVVLFLLTWYALMPKAASAASRTAAKAIAVDTATVSRADVPIYLQGLGTVQAFNSVTARARVDGELQTVAFTEGQFVRKGDLLAQIDPRPHQAAYEQAVAVKAKDAVMLANARRDLARYMELQPEGLVSKQALDTQRATVDQAVAQLQVDEALVANARTQLEYTRITSPIAGRTGIRQIDQGNVVHATDVAGIVTVTQIQPISVVFTLPEEALDSVSTAYRAGPVEVVVMSRDGGAVIEKGKLVLIDNQVDTGTATIKFKATFANARNTLWPGQYVNARVLVRADKARLTVPSAAVQVGPTGPFTYVVKDDLTVDARLLKIGAQSGDLTVVTQGLSLNERVVTTNQYRLQPGALVKPRDPQAK